MAALATLLAVALVLVGACGSEEEETGPPTAGPRPSQTATSGPGPASEPAPTVDPGIPLVAFRSPDKGYSLRYPEGWEVDATPGGGTDAFLWRIGDRRLALLQVTCNRELLTPQSLMRADASVASNLGGYLNLADAVPMQVGGVEGKQNRYSLSVGGLTIEHVVAYVAIGDCGWRIGLNSYGTGSLNPYLPLFDRILASFHFD